MSEHYLKAELYGLVQQDQRIFEFLQQGSLDGVWFWDIENPEQEWLSPEFKALFGYQDNEIPNTSEWWQSNIHPNDLQLALDNFEKHLADPSHAYDQIVRYRHKNGSTVWVRCRGLAIRDEQGKPIRMLGCHQDVTALKEREQGLSTFQMLAENSQELVAVLTADAALTYLNPAAKQALGIEEQSQWPLPLAQLLSDIDCQSTWQRWTQMLKNGQAVREEINLAHQQEPRSLPVEWRLFAIESEDNELIGYGCHSLFLAERRALQDAKLAAERERVSIDERKRYVSELERANEAWSSFAYTVAHDLRGPIANIGGFASLLDEHVDEDGQELLGFINDICDNAQGLINALVDYAKLGHDMHFAEVDMEQALEDAVKLLEHEKVQSRLLMNKETELPPVSGSASLITNLLVNLLSNAVKYNDHDCAEVQIGFEDGEYYVRDNGIGIAESKTKEAFEVFRRLNPEPEYGEGMGVGLATVKRIMQLHQGQVRVESSVGRGSCFYLKFNADD